MSLLDFLLVFRLVLFVAILLALWVVRSRILPFLGQIAFVFISIGMFTLIVAQTSQTYAHFSEQIYWKSISVYLFVVADFAFVIGMVWAILACLELAKNYQNSDQREQWLRQIYENLPTAIFAIEDGKIIYSNEIFKALQFEFDQENPFSEVTESEQEVWLESQCGERIAFLVNQFPLEKTSGNAFIITDITSVKLQGSFIQQVAKDLKHQQSTTMQSMLDLIYEFSPNATFYVGEYNEDNQKFRHVAHQGDGEHFFYADLELNEMQFQPDDWTWFDATSDNSLMPSLAVKLKSEFYGGIILRDEQEIPLGVILVLQKEKVGVTELLMDFLSIFSIRVRSELEHLKDKRMIEQSSNRYRAFIENSVEAIADIRLQPSIQVDDSINEQWANMKRFANLEEVNPAFLELFECDRTPTEREFFSIKSLKHLLRYLLESGYSSEVIEVAHEKQNGDIHWISCAVMVEIQERRLHRVWLIIRDITDSKSHIQHLEYQAHHDNLTGLANRAALRMYLDEKIDQANQFGFQSALILIDLDRFKEINDALGHQYGDVLLKKIEPRVRSIINERRAFIARLGGDEFAIVVPTVHGEQEARLVAMELLKKLKEPFDLGQLNVEIGCSMGIALYPDNGKETSTLMRCADIAMYKAKKDKSSILIYRNEMDENSPRRLALMTDMNKGLRNNEFFLVYQPKLDLKTNEINAAEALIRWQHDDLDLINPSEFIPLAEMSDVIITMTYWVIDQALKQVKLWMEQGSFIKTAVNVSTRNLMDEDLIEFIRSKLEFYQVPAHLLEIEITESALMVDPEHALHTLNKISEMGVSISVDDFGTGYSSFIYLRRLPISTLKIDIMFVRNMCNNEQDEIIVNSIINLAHNLSLNVVAEGAEDLKTVERLRSMSCNMVQGYYVCKPVSADEFISQRTAWGENLIDFD